MSWGRGAADVEAMLRDGTLERVHGAQADGRPWLEKAQRTLVTARGIGSDDPESAYVLGYDAARFACTGLLAQQGLRPTTKGGHYVIDQVVRAQFHPVLARFGGLRRRRNELEYPSYPGETVDLDELAKAYVGVAEICDAAEQLIGELTRF